MANEYLTRTLTSTGNQQVWTYSVWIKTNDVSNTNYLFGYFDEGASPTPRGTIQFNESNEDGKTTVGWNPTGSAWYQTQTEGYHRDCGNWLHLCIAVDTTKTDEGDGIKMYFNGAKESATSYLGTWGSDAAALNINTGFNSLVEHYINGFSASSGRGEVQYSDFFWVDGQALGPDVFGFYKDGDGYQSSGTTQATDFRSGKWSPRSPKSIKHTINRSGGFGVNGFYLPFNDSSNPGADFHCTPNSIIKLKGEDLPQPRNGAPTTSDVYVSQLREEKGSEDLPFEGVARFGGDGTLSSLKFPDHSDLDLGGGPFTAECWIYPQDTSGANFGALFNKGYGFQVYWKSDNENLQLFASSDGSSYNMINGVTSQEGSVPKGKWCHIAVTRSGNTWYMFTNGKQTYGPLNVTGTVHNNGNPWAIGDYAPVPGSYEFKGFISDFRLVHGTAVYTAPFTPPTTRLTNITNTKLLCCQSATSVTEAAVAPTTGGTAGGAETFATKNELSGSIVLAVPFISHLIGSNKITNGIFDTVSDGQDGYDNGDGTVDGWGKNGNSSLSINGNALRFTQTNNGSWQGGNANYAMGSEFVVGKTYSVKYKIRSSGNGNYSQGVGARIQKGSSWHSSNSEFYKETNSDPGTSWKTIYWTWTATQTNYGIEFYNWYGVQNSWIEIDDVEVKEAVANRYYDAGSNRLNKGGLYIEGTVNKTKVAEGSDLVYYSGFSANNYLIQKPDTRLDFGTGDFYVMYWVNFTKNDAYDNLMGRRYHDGSNFSGQGWYLEMGGNNNVTMKDGSSNASRAAIDGDTIFNTWQHHCFMRKDSHGYSFRNGVMTSNFYNAWTTNLDNSNASFIIGRVVHGSGNASDSKLALVRVGAGAPTEEQVRKIYDDEKVLFEENAKCTLYGTNPACQKRIAYDDSTNILHAGTTAGRSEFSGLRRINNTTAAVTTAISASNELVVEQ